MTYKNIKFDVDADGIATLAIDLEGQSMNVWNAELMAEFEQAVDKVLGDDTIKGAVVTSAKDSGFLAGADLRMLGSSSGPVTAKTAFESAFRLNAILRKMESGGKSAKDLAKGETTKPIAAAINGLALGGGFELALACHYRVVSDNPKVQFGFPEVQVGLLPGAGGTQRTPRLAGIQNALQLCSSGSSIDAGKAKAQNLIHEIVPHADIVKRAKEWVKANPKTKAPWDEKGFKFPGGAGAMDPRVVPVFMGASALGQQLTNHNYPAVQKILSCVYEGSIVPFDTALRIESKYFTTLLMSPQAQNMIRTLFINKQAAEKGMARPKSVPQQKIGTVGVLGAGMMGAGIAYVTAKSGMNVVLLDREIDYANKGKAYSESLNAKGVSRGKLTKEKSEEMLARIKTTTDYNDLKDVDLIIEAVFEDPAIKADVIQKTEAVIRKDVVFASNTSTIPISNLAKNSSRPDQFIGIHFFSPVDKMPLVEIIPGDKSGDLPLAVALDYVGKIKKTPIVVSDTRGFYCNSVVMPYLNEAMLMVQEGINPALIDNCAKQMGMPVGPLSLTDETSLDLGLKISNAAKAELGDKYKPTGVEDMLAKMVNELGRLGRKSGGGFYEYPEGGKKYLWPDLAKHFPASKEQPSAEEVTERLLYCQLVAVANCYAAGVVHDPQSADLGAIFGWGFAPWTGGPMSHIDTMGVDTFVATADKLAQKYGPRFAPPAMFREKANKSERFYKAA